MRASRNVDVRIIIGKFEDKWLQGGREAHGIAISKLLGIHERMLIIDDMLFVGSVDLDNPGLNVHDNLTMQTTDTTALLSAKDVWPGFSRMQCQT